jgi:SMI1-KNR4 cell-wall
VTIDRESPSLQPRRGGSGTMNSMRYDELREALRARPDLEAGTPLPPQEIDLAERRLGRLPEDYRAFLEELGWVSLGPHEVFGLGVDIPPYLDVVRVNESEWTEGQLPRHLVAVMNDGAGNLSCIDLAAPPEGDAQTVVLWDHEVSPSEGPIPLASTFSDLLGRVLLTPP